MDERFNWVEEAAYTIDSASYWHMPLTSMTAFTVCMRHLLSQPDFYFMRDRIKLNKLTVDQYVHMLWAAIQVHDELKRS